MKDSSNNYLNRAAWLQDLFDEAPDLIQIVQLDGTLLFVNKAWSAHLGYSKEEIQGESIYSFIQASDCDRFKEYRKQIINGELSDDSIIIKLQAKNGQLIPVEGVVTVKQVDGTTQYTRGIFRDITLRLQYESQLLHLNQELKEREQNLQELLLRAPDAVIVINRNSRITFWNPKAEQLFGWKTEEVLGGNLSDMIIPPQHREAHARGMDRYLKTGEAHVLNRTIEITALKSTGEEFYVALTISQTQQRGEIAFIAFIRDIHIQKQNQLELERKTQLLLLSNTHLEDFAHAASHDMKEPLRKIRTFTDRLRISLGARINEHEAVLLERIENSAERMQLLVDDLLEFSYANEHRQLLEEINLNEKIRRVLGDLELLIEEKGAKIITSNLPTIKGNRRQFQQLFHNLISNALKYSRKDVRPVVRIIARIVKGSDIPFPLPKIDLEKQFHLIEVIDNGIGFEQEYAQQIFEMFQRLHGKAEYTGTGIGLAIAKKVVSNHHGHIWATGIPGEGATFHILLPFE